MGRPMESIIYERCQGWNVSCSPLAQVGQTSAARLQSKVPRREIAMAVARDHRRRNPRRPFAGEATRAAVAVSARVAHPWSGRESARESAHRDRVLPHRRRAPPCVVRSGAGVPRDARRAGNRLLLPVLRGARHAPELDPVPHPRRSAARLARRSSGSGRIVHGAMSPHVGLELKRVGDLGVAREHLRDADHLHHAAIPYPQPLHLRQVKARAPLGARGQRHREGQAPP